MEPHMASMSKLQALRAPICSATCKPASQQG